MVIIIGVNRQDLQLLARTRLADDWDLVQDWSEHSRYQRFDSGKTRALVEAIGDRKTWSNGLDKTALVAADIATGAELVRALDRSGLSVSVALWLYSSDRRLAFCSRITPPGHGPTFGSVWSCP